MSKAIVLCLTALFLACQVQAQDSLQNGQTISLRNAIEIALKNNYQIKQANNNIQRADYNLLSAKANFLPSVSGRLSGGRQIGQQFNQTTISFKTQTVNSTSGSIGASITLFSGLRNIYELRSATNNKLSLQEQADQTKEDIILGAASSYLQVLLDKQLLDIANENLKSSQQQLDQIKAQVQVGAKPIADQYNQEATVANNQLTKTQDENSLNVDRLKLIRQLQIDPLKTYNFVTPNLDTTAIKVKHYNIREMIKEALMTRNDIRSQKYNIQATYDNLKVAESQLYPTLSLSGQLSTNYNDKYTDRITGNLYPFGKQFFNLNVNKYIGFSLSIPIFNNLSTRYNVQSSMINYKNAQLNFENLRLQVIQELQQAYSDYLNYDEQLKSTETALVAARKAYETQQERYRVGAGTLLELTQANANFVQASSTRLQALYRFVFQEQLLNYYIGKISPDMKINALNFN